MAIYLAKKRHCLGLFIGVMLSIKENNHDPNPSKMMIFEYLNNINQSTTSVLLSLSSITLLVQRTLRGANTPSPNLNFFASIVVPAEYTLSHMSEQFLLYDSGPDKNQIFKEQQLGTLNIK
ncbi:hypothetical protein RF11_02513 [Thelohanellus kitauei]|uniref:Uncharacterized protein n=1 Tax=Thelohanellus kitauei TaxID=669202 RepID=A0A0C2NAP0_THEKT|nr:hypothetical protein RF11_02513 [Thelohanellus kitauei]